MKYRLHAVDADINSYSDEPFCRFVEKSFRNEPVHLFTKFSKHKQTIPKKLEATDVRRGFRWAYVQEYTVQESYEEEKIDFFASSRDLMNDFYQFYCEVLAKIERNDKFLNMNKLNPLKSEIYVRR